VATRAPVGPNITTGRRGYLRYQYGEHFWIPEVLADFSKGMVRDTTRVAIPNSAVYDSADFLLDQPGIARKRGGTSYAFGPLSGAAYLTAIEHVPFSGGPHLVSISNNAHLFDGATDVGAVSGNTWFNLAVSPGGTYVIIPFPAANAQKYNATTITTLAQGIPIAHTVSYKSRLVASGQGTNRLFFSPVPDVNATWDTANSWIDCDNQVSGLASLNNTLLIFSAEATERIIGATPPPNSDMDRAPVANVGCTDCRSIVMESPYVYFANPQGVYMTNGSTPVSLTQQGGIRDYWRSLFNGYVTAAPMPSISSWTIASGFWRGFLIVTVLDGSRNLVACLMCNVAQAAWWRLTNIRAMSWATSLLGNELYYADGIAPYVTATSGIFAPAAANKADANGTAVTPTIEFRPVGQGTGTKAYAWGHLDVDMRDAASDNPTMGVTVKLGVEADTILTPPESPLAETTTLNRYRFQINRNALNATVALAQTGPSAKTEIYALEVQNRPQSLVGEGVS